MRATAPNCRVDVLTPEAQARALCAGDIDAFAIVTAVPAANVDAAVRGCGAQLVPLETSIEAALADAVPDLELMAIPADAYPNIEAPVNTLGVRATMLTRDVVPDHIVRELVEAVIDDFARVRAAHPATSDLEPSQMAIKGLGAPLHDAATAVFAAEGVL